MLAVLVLNDSVSGLVEAATYCAPNDDKRPIVVGLPDFTTTQICPEDGTAVAELTDASPDSWYVRVMFDELLDPNIEDLIEILDDNNQPTGTFDGSLARTQPVILECVGVDGAMHNVDYDGYYSPSGNNVTWPLGPSLVIKQLGTAIVPTNSECQITLKDNIKDKQGNSVPMAQRGPFKFKVAPIKALVIDPSDGAKVDAVAIYSDNVYIQTNAEVTDPGAGPFTDAAGLPGFSITPEPGFCANTGAPCITTAHCDAGDPADLCEAAGVYSYSLAPFGFTPQEFGFGPNGYPETESTYSFEITAGSKVDDVCGSTTTFGDPDVDTNTKITVTTNKFDLKTSGAFNIISGDVIPPNRRVKVNFTAPLSQSAGLGLPDVADTAFTIVPAPMLNATTPLTNAEMLRVTPFVENDLTLRGHYQPDTMYTFTLKDGAVITDSYGKTYTQAGDKVIMFKTQPIALTSSTPASGSTVTKATPTSATTISLSFNQGMDVTTYDATDVELIGAPTALTFTASGCGTTSTSCSLRASGVFTPGDYTFKLKQGAAIKDALGNDYTQAADRLIKFTVKEATPSVVTPCLGAP